jgi:hypothetical protein
MPEAMKISAIKIKKARIVLTKITVKKIGAALIQDSTEISRQKRVPKMTGGWLLAPAHQPSR